MPKEIAPEKPTAGVSPRDAAAAAALSRASAGGRRPDLGASIPAKTLVEHKAENGMKNILGKGQSKHYCSKPCIEDVS